jgi:epoxyqueuosine reductase
VADLSPARDFITSQGGLEVGGYPRAVSIGIALLNPIVDQLPNRAEAATAIEYRHHAYDATTDTGR